MNGYKNLSFSTLKILATVKQKEKYKIKEKCFSTLKILATVKLAVICAPNVSVLVPLRF